MSTVTYPFDHYSIETETVILGVLPDRKKATVKAFLRGIPQHLRHMIHFVWTDMYGGRCIIE